jgi:hypothetical protein
VLTFFAPIDGKSSGAVAYRKLIDEYNSSHKGVHVIFEGIATADGFNQYLEERLDSVRVTIFLLLMKIESSLCTVKDIFAIFRVWPVCRC